VITALIINVDSTPMAGADRYLPEPAMGNQKPGTAEYTLKWQEKRNKQLQDLQDHAFLSKPVAIRWAWAQFNGAGFGYVAGGTADAVKVFFDAIDASKKASGFCPTTGVICGVHPTTQMRVLLNTAIRHGVQIPSWLISTRRVNPWQSISTSAEGEYPVPWVGLGMKPEGPIEDTFALLKALGGSILNPALKE